MKTAVEALPAGTWDPSDTIATVTLTWEQRQRRRVALHTDPGEPFLLNLPRPAFLAEGDGLKLEEGGILDVRAAAEDVLEVTATHADTLARYAWHLGNRHLAVQIVPSTGDRPPRIRMAYDHVIEDMLKGLGALPERLQAPFQPERGAYHGDHHSHAHSHD